MKKCWLISVNMGYGHQRTAYPLKDIAFKGEIINANDYRGIPKGDRQIWETTRNIYEFISRFSRIPLVGSAVFSFYDQFQKILKFYPRRDLSKPTSTLKEIYAGIKRGWGRHLIEKIKEKPLPFLTTFFTPAFMAEYFNYPGEIFCVVCDADISRSWVPLNPKKSRIKYLTPNKRTAERLELYGVKKGNIFLTGYPLPKENIGGKNLKILKIDLKKRLLNLDPESRFFGKYRNFAKETLGKFPEKSGRPLTLLFSVGGAGAQKDLAPKIIKSLKKELALGKIKIVLSAGKKLEVKEYFEKIKGKYKNIEILFNNDISGYFTKFNQCLREADILWTKPSELSFYSALGLPIIIAPPIGSQEQFNMRWLLKSGFGMRQENPAWTNQWLFDWIKQGYLAEAAFEGFIEGEKMGTYNIEKIIFKQ